MAAVVCLLALFKQRSRKTGAIEKHCPVVDRIWIYQVQAEEASLLKIQYQITRFAAQDNLAIVKNEPLKLELETVFLQLVGKRS